MNKENVVLHTMKYYLALRKKKILQIGICSNIDEPGEHYVKWGKLDTEQMLQNTMKQSN